VTQIIFDGATARSLERTYQTADLVAQRARVLQLLAPGAGERILDIGVGPGLLALELARAVGPEGEVVGIDVSADMLAMASARLQGLGHARCVEGGAERLEFSDGAFDAAVSTQVYEYVADMPRALAELCRVLRPGGRALILDSDWRSVVWRSSDEARMARVLEVWDGHLVDPHLPARLGPMMRAAGFAEPRVEVLAMLTPSWREQTYAAGIMRQVRDYALRHGPGRGLEAAEVEAWWADQQALIAAGEFFFSLNRYLFLATRS
jgi:ubiquinone/menaquinone biosynthesis C-methylase UbiE